ALTIRLSLGGNDDPLVATSLYHLGTISRRRGDRTAARSFYEQALAIEEGSGAAPSLERAEILNNLGLVDYDDRKYAEARDRELEALHIKEQLLGRRHPRVAVTLQNLGAVALAQNNLEEAEKLVRRAIA